LAFEAASVLRREASEAASRARLDSPRAEGDRAGGQALARECFQAFNSGKPERVLELVQRSLIAWDSADMVDFAAQDDSGMTILHYACRHLAYELIRILLLNADGPKLKANVTVFFFNSLT